MQAEIIQHSIDWPLPEHMPGNVKYIRSRKFEDIRPNKTKTSPRGNVSSKALYKMFSKDNSLNLILCTFPSLVHAKKRKSQGRSQVRSMQQLLQHTTPSRQ